MAGKIHVGDIGMAFRATAVDQDGVPINVSNYTIKFLFKKPDGTVVQKNGSFVSDGIDGKVQYITLAGDLDQKGTWKMQVRITNPSNTIKLSSLVKSFAVVENVDA
jgi:hypothetical protein